MLLVSLAFATTPVLLPPGEDPAAWASAMRLADLRLGTGRPGIELLPADGRWLLMVWSAESQLTVVVVTPPTTAREREGIALLATSLLARMTAPDTVAPSLVPPIPAPVAPRPPPPIEEPPPLIEAPPSIVAEEPVPQPPVPPVAPIAELTPEPPPPPVPPPPPPPLAVALDLRAGAAIRGGLDGAPIVGLGLQLGDTWAAQIGVQGQFPAAVSGVDATIERWSGSVGGVWSPPLRWAPTVGLGATAALLHLRAPDADELYAPTLAPWGELGLRGRITPRVVLRLGVRVGADLRATIITPPRGADIELSRVWVEPAVSIATDLQ